MSVTTLAILDRPNCKSRDTKEVPDGWKFYTDRIWKVNFWLW
jgi:hypothetical protein